MENNSAKKILLAISYDVERGGVQSVLTTWVKNISRDSVDYTWYFGGDIKEEKLYDEIVQQGVKVITGNHGVMKMSFIHLFKYIKYLRSIISDIKRVIIENDIEIIHINNGELIFCALLAKAAKKRGMKVIVHSHSSGAMTASWLKKLLLIPIRKIIVQNTDLMVACSDIAARAMFGKRNVSKVTIVNNFIDAEKFRFSSERRNTIRQKYDLTNKFVIGQVARLSVEKNQKFLIDIFNIILQENESVRLLLVGTGPIEEELKTYVNESGLSGKVIFVGNTNTPEEYYSSMDMFILTSTFEGLSLSTIEAQTSGLRCIVADTIPLNAIITNYVEYASLDSSPIVWAKMVLDYINQTEKINREDMWGNTVKAGWDKSCISEKLVKLYSSSALDSQR